MGFTKEENSDSKLCRIHPDDNNIELAQIAGGDPCREEKSSEGSFIPSRSRGRNFSHLLSARRGMLSELPLWSSTSIVLGEIRKKLVEPFNLALMWFLQYTALFMYSFVCFTSTCRFACGHRFDCENTEACMAQQSRSDQKSTNTIARRELSESL